MCYIKLLITKYEGRHLLEKITKTPIQVCTVHRNNVCQAFQKTCKLGTQPPKESTKARSLLKVGRFLF